MRHGRGETASLRRVGNRREADQELGLTDWYLEDGWLRRKYNTDGWPQTLMAVNAIGYLCEAAWHHADLAVTWGKLWVKLKTHDAGGITDKDFELAKKIEEVVLWRPTGGALHRQPEEVRVQQVTRRVPDPIDEFALPLETHDRLSALSLLARAARRSRSRPRRSPSPAARPTRRTSSSLPGARRRRGRIRTPSTCRTAARSPPRSQPRRLTDDPAVKQYLVFVLPKLKAGETVDGHADHGELRRRPAALQFVEKKGEPTELDLRRR